MTLSSDYLREYLEAIHHTDPVAVRPLTSSCTLLLDYLLKLPTSKKFLRFQTSDPVLQNLPIQALHRLGFTASKVIWEKKNPIPSNQEILYVQHTENHCHQLGYISFGLKHFSSLSAVCTQMKDGISFSKEDDFFSPFHPCEIKADGLTFPSCFSYYAWLLSLDSPHSEIMRSLIEGNKGNEIDSTGLIATFESRVPKITKSVALYDALYKRFEQPEARRRLLETHPKPLVFISPDRFLGFCGEEVGKHSRWNRVGKNILGQHLVQIRNCFRDQDENVTKAEDYHTVQSIHLDFKADWRVLKGSKNYLPIQGGHLFKVDEFLTPTECKDIIQKVDEYGWKEISNEYSPEYRKATRCVVQSKQFANLIWERLLPVLEQEDIFGVRPFGFGNEGTWIPKGINECLRFTKYVPGDFFKPHKDGSFVVNNSFRSVYSIFFYLSDSFQGGETIFYSPGTIDKPNDQLKPIHTVLPKIGTALVFNHDLNHEGAPVLQGTKYIMRTDVMFQRVFASSNDNFNQDPEYLRSEKLYQESIQLQKSGDPLESTRAYLQALEIQARLPSIPRPFGPEVKLFFHDCFSVIFQDFSVKELVIVSAVSRGLHHVIFHHNTFWKARYFSTWPTDEEKALMLGNPNPFQTNWFALLKKRTIGQSLFDLTSIDIGSYSLIYSKSDASQVLRTTLHDYSGHFWSGNEGREHFEIGHEESPNQPWAGQYRVFPEKKKVDWRVWTNLLLTLVQDKLSSTVPYVYVKPLWFSKTDVRYVIDVLLTECQVFYLGIIDEPVATLYAYNSSSVTGLVLNLGHSLTTLSVVVNGRVKASKEFPVSGVDLFRFYKVAPVREANTSNDNQGEDYKEAPPTLAPEAINEYSGLAEFIVSSVANLDNKDMLLSSIYTAGWLAGDSDLLDSLESNLSKLNAGCHVFRPPTLSANKLPSQGAVKWAALPGSAPQFLVSSISDREKALEKLYFHESPSSRNLKALGIIIVSDDDFCNHRAKKISFIDFWGKEHSRDYVDRSNLAFEKSWVSESSSWPENLFKDIKIRVTYDENLSGFATLYQGAWSVEMKNRPLLLPVVGPRGEVLNYLRVYIVATEEVQPFLRMFEDLLWNISDE